MSMKDIDPNEIQDEIDDELYNYVVTRDNGICQVCGAPGVEVHHVKYKSLGGKNKANNLILLCWLDHKVMEHGKKPKSKEFYFERIKINERRLRKNLV